MPGQGPESTPTRAETVSAVTPSRTRRRFSAGLWCAQAVMLITGTPILGWTPRDSLDTTLLVCWLAGLLAWIGLFSRYTRRSGWTFRRTGILTPLAIACGCGLVGTIVITALQQLSPTGLWLGYWALIGCVACDTVRRWALRPPARRVHPHPSTPDRRTR